MNRGDFQRLAELRLEEAKALFAAGFPEGAYYLAGYAVECALKACIAKKTQQHAFPDKKLAERCYTHDLEALLKAAELSELFKQARVANSRLDLQWEIVQGWSEQSRYERFSGHETVRMTYASLLLNAVETKEGGILRWIKQHW